MDVKAIQARLAAHAVERNWDPFFSPRSLSMAVAGEAGALLAVFQWLSEDQARRVGHTPDRKAVVESIADIVLYALRLAETVDVDLEEAVLARAAEKYPVSARRFASVDEYDAGESSPAVRQSPSAGTSPAPKIAPAGSAPAKSAHETPVRPPPPKAREEEPDEEIRIDVEPPREADARPPVRSDPQPRGRAEPTARERADPQPRAKAESPARERADPPPRARAEAPPRARAEPSARERVDPAPPAQEEPPPRAERYADLDTEAVLDLMKGLKKRIDDARTEDAILHEIKDEMDTLRRNVYSPRSKPAWIAGGLERLRALLEEAAVNPVGDKVNFKDYIARISRMLE